MRGTVAAVIVAGVLGAGCSGGGESCGFGDSAIGISPGFTTPELALHSVLVREGQHIAQNGWVKHQDTATSVTFSNSRDQVAVVRDKSRTWHATAVTVCD